MEYSIGLKRKPHSNKNVYSQKSNKYIHIIMFITSVYSNINSKYIFAYYVHTYKGIYVRW